MWSYVYITLSDADCAEAIEVGTERDRQGNEREYQQMNGIDPTPEQSLANHILGAAGEQATCFVTNRPWSKSLNSFKSEPDIWPDIEVRTARRMSDSLIVRERDKPKRRFVLVLGDLPTFCVQGWYWGDWAKRNVRWKRTYNDGSWPAWFVPQSDLFSISDLVTDAGRL